MEQRHLKKLLLLGGGHAEIPLIQAAQALGWYVITTGNDRKGLGHPYADKNVFADFSDKDAMLELARTEGVQAVCSGCNDFALLSTVYVCEKLGFPGHDSYATSLEIHHKDKYRALATRLKIPTPRALVVPKDTDADFDAAIASLDFPIIVKPVDLTGGKGIHRANTPEEARAAYKDACSRTRQDHIVVEEFVTGTNHGFSAMLVKGKVAFAFADNEQYYINKYMVSGANTPGTSGSETLAKLRDYSERRVLIWENDDAHRNVYVINGRRFDSSDPNSPHGEDLSRQVIAAFKGAAPSEKAQKALSCLMHQGMMQNFMSLAMKAPPDPGEVAMHERPGADLFAHRDMTTGLFALPLLDNSTMQTTYTLDVAPDGNTATVTVSASPGLTEGSSPGDVFGHVQLTRQMTVDLRPDVPVVTDVKLAQKLVP